MDIATTSSSMDHTTANTTGHLEPAGHIDTEDHHGCNNSEHPSGNDAPHLLEIPQEILLHIFSFIGADYLLGTVAHVCQDLKHLLLDEEYWKIRLFKRFPKPYPIVREPSFSWTDACKQRESFKKIWKSVDLNNNLITLNKACGSAIDAVHLTKNNAFCICGGRDRTVTIWKLNNEAGPIYEANSPQEFVSESLPQHKGWVWSITSNENEFCSTSFDTTVKFWDIGALGVKLSINAGGPVLCSSYMDDNVVVVGCYNKKTMMIDSRSGIVVKDMTFHKRSVLCVESNNNIIASTGEDGLIILLDKRKNTILQEIKSSSFCMALDLHESQIWTGAKDGSIGVYDIHDPNEITQAANLDYGYSGKITGLRYTSGAVYSGSTDGWMKIHEPSLDPEPIASIQLLGSGGVTDISVLDKTLAVSTGEGLVALWRPYLTECVAT